MDRVGESFTTCLKEVHLNWGTVGTTDGGPRKRHELETYIPISAEEARRLDLKTGETFSVYNQEFLVRVSGSQGEENRYGKNLESNGNLKLLGSYLKNELKLLPGCKVRVAWYTNDTVQIEQV